jgi:hypothetical protein
MNYVLKKCNGARRGQPCESSQVVAKGLCRICYGAFRRSHRAAEVKVERTPWEYEPTPEQVDVLIQKYGETGFRKTLEPTRRNKNG